MKAEYISKLFATVWDLPLLRARTILSNIVLKVMGEDDPDADAGGNPGPKMQILGNVALIPLRGVISMNVPDWIKAYGFDLVDANDIEDWLNQALADANVELIVFDIDSPGGWDLASIKLFELIEAANKKKPCFAFCGDGGDMASGAYFAAAACTALYAGWYAAGVGCVGCYLAMLDDTEYWAKLGIKFEIFRSGELKGLGGDGGLTAPQREYLQSRVAMSGDRFRKCVLKYRTTIDPADLDGRWFEGLEAAVLKFRKMI